MIIGIIIAGIVGIVISRVITGRLFGPIFLYNATWTLVSILVKINLFSLYPVSDKVYYLVILGIIFFDLGFIFSNISVKKGNSNNKIVEDDRFDSKKARNALIIIQVLLGILLIPLIVKAFHYISTSGLAYLRFVYSANPNEHYMNMFERMFYIQYFVFPLAYATQLIALVLFLTGKFKLKDLVPSVVLLFFITAITAGRLVVFQFFFQLVAIYVIMKRPLLNKERKLTNKYKFYFLIPIVILFLVYITSVRITGGNSFKEIIKSVVIYFTGSFNTLTISLENPKQYGIRSSQLYGLGSVAGLIDPFITFIRILGIRIDLIADQINKYTDGYLLISQSQIMNAFFTSFYVFMRDFGVLGVGICSLFFGVVVAKTKKMFYKRKTVLSLSIYVMALFCVFFSILRWEPYLVTFWTKLFYVICLNKILFNHQLA